MTFSEQIWYGLFKPSKYKELLELRARRSVAFVVVIMLVLGLVTFVVPVAAIITGFGGMNKLFTETMAPVSYDGEKLSIEKPFKLVADGNIFIINTDNATVADEELKSDGIYMAFGSQNMRLVSVIGGEIWSDSALPLNQMLTAGFNNDSLVAMIPILYLSLFLGFLFNCLTFFIKYAIFALILSIFINSMNRQFELGLSRGQVFMLCFYGQSMGMVVSNFNLAMRLVSPTFVSIITIFVSIHFITTAVMLMQKGKQL